MAVPLIEKRLCGFCVAAILLPACPDLGYWFIPHRGCLYDPIDASDLRLACFFLVYHIAAYACLFIAAYFGLLSWTRHGRLWPMLIVALTGALISFMVWKLEIRRVYVPTFRHYGLITYISSGVGQAPACRKRHARMVMAGRSLPYLA